MVSIAKAEEPDFVRALARGLELIECFDAEHPRLSLSEIAERAGLSRATARRVLITLERMGYVAADNGLFWPKPRMLRLGYSYLSTEPLWTLATPYLQDVNREIGQTCSVAVLDGNEIVFVARVAAKRLTRDYIPIGFRWPAYCTSLGRVLLAGLDEAALDRYFATVMMEPLTEHTVTDPAELRRRIAEVRRRGWASSDQETELGLRSVGVPIRDREGRVAAAMNTNALAHRTEMALLERDYVPVLQRAAAAVSEAISWRR